MKLNKEGCMEKKKQMPWQRHSSTWDVPWNKRAEQKFDSDKIKFRYRAVSISLSGVIALSIFFISVLSIIL
jgi:hypothetical protein